MIRRAAQLNAAERTDTASIAAAGRVSVTTLLLSAVVSMIVAVALAASATQALAAPSAWWNLNTSLRPATLKPGGEGTFIVQALNIGDASTSGPAVITATLPQGLSIVEKEGVPQVSFFGPLKAPGGFDLGPGGPFGSFEMCKATSNHLTCSTSLASFPEEARPFWETVLGQIAPFEQLEIEVKVKEQGVAPESRLQAEVSGASAPSLTKTRSLTVSQTDAAFGVEEFSLVPEEEGGAVDARAGSHPFQLTNTFNLNQSANPGRPPAPPRNLNFKLPPGQLGNPQALPKCSAPDFATELGGSINLCPSDTALGVANITIYEPNNVELHTEPVPIFNLEPKRGEPARFGFVVASTPVILDTSVRSGPGEDYGVTVSSSNTTEIANLISSTVTFWGAPADVRHNDSRGFGCLASGFFGKQANIPCEAPSQSKPTAFLTLPTNCAAPFATTVEGDSWPTTAVPPGPVLPLTPFTYSLRDPSGNPLGLLGCNELPFSPTISMKASTDSASSPSGLDVNLDFHDEGLLAPNGVAQSQLKDTTVTLPEGFTINPSAGVGLGGCSAADYARETVESAPGAGCPNNSKLGTVEIETPLLTQKIQGSLFIAQPHENPFDSLVALYIVAKNPETGILIKLAGKVTPNPVTGQLVTTFENAPQLPFDHFNFHFREGQQAPLITPATCGTYTTQAQLTPWSDPSTALTDTSSFTITKGAEGGPCPTGAPPFHPQLQAGTINNNAGTFSPLDVRLTRTDAEAEISSFSTNLPPGLTGILSGIPFCPEASIALARTRTGAQEEAEPSCPASQIGRTLVGTGVGAVLAYVPGKIYLAGPYHGDPFSIVSVTSAVVGPFDLGTVVLRFALRIDPFTAQVSVDPSASEPIPHIIQGIVTHVRDIRIYIDRPNFTLNPTSCAPTAISSTLGSNLGQSVSITSPFQAASCANLKFAPKFEVSTSGKTSRAKGASLSVKLSYPNAPQGTQANIAKVKVDLPKQLPSRLTTLQKACTSAQFELNPANCPKESKIGMVTVTTPLLPVPLNGPAIFVSHGGEAFPSLTMVLQGYGVTVDLVGTTFISRAGITSTTFKTVPDVPFNTFELTLPQGKFSALAANGNLCKNKLAMPTAFVAQNGLTIHQSTKIKVTGCTKHMGRKKHKKTRGKKKKK